MARQAGMHHELVLIDQSQLRQCQRELHASHEQSLARLPPQLLDGLPQIPAHELRVPIDPVRGARHDVLLCRVDRPGEGFHPIRPRSRRRPKRCLHHFQSIGGMEVGSIWGHGSYVAPDWTADWLHREAVFILDSWSGSPGWYASLSRERQAELQSRLEGLLRANTYADGTVTIDPIRAEA